jgi:chromate reductase, NAD(P)H dehydrogenase (quinone)
MRRPAVDNLFVKQEGALSVLGIAGSLRHSSLNRSLLRAASQLALTSLQIEVFDLAAIPLFNSDVEAAGDPDAVVVFKNAIRKADAVLIATPEYNHGVPGVLKNAIDWASRPANASPLAGKPIGILGASPGLTGTARAQSQLRQAFAFTNSPAMLQPEFLLARAREKFDASGGSLVDHTTVSLLRRYLSAFEPWVRGQIAARQQVQWAQSAA